MRARGSFSALSKYPGNWRVAVAPRSSKGSILAAIAFSASFILSISAIFVFRAGFSSSFMAL